MSLIPFLYVAEFLLYDIPLQVMRDYMTISLRQRISLRSANCIACTDINSYEALAYADAPADNHTWLRCFNFQHYLQELILKRLEYS